MTQRLTQPTPNFVVSATFYQVNIADTTKFAAKK